MVFRSQGKVAMKIRFQKSRFLDKLTPAMGTVSNKNTIASIEGVLIETVENRDIKLSTYDMKKGMVSLLEADSVEEGGSFIINAARLLQILRVMPGEDITLEVDEKFNAVIKSGKSEFSLFALRGSDFPNIPLLNSEKGFEIASDVLKEMIGKVLHSVAEQDSRPVLCGAYFRLHDGIFDIVSCDSFTLSVCAKKCEIKDIGAIESEEFDFIVPGHALNELMRILPDGEEKINVYITRKHAIFRMDEMTFFTRLIDEDYIDYSRIIPKEQTIFVTVDREKMLEGLERANLVAEEKGQGNSRSYVKIILDGEILTLTSTSVSGKVYDELECSHTGDNIEIGFNCRYLINSIRAAEGEKILITMKSARQSITIEPLEKKEEENFFYMVLPVRMAES